MANDGKEEMIERLEDLKRVAGTSLIASVILLLGVIILIWQAGVAQQQIVSAEEKLVNTPMMNGQVNSEYKFLDALDKVNFAGAANADGSADLSFKSHWTTKPYRYLEKVNLSCIERYDYVVSKDDLSRTNDLMISRLKLLDKGCQIIYAEPTNFGNTMITVNPLNNSDWMNTTQTRIPVNMGSVLFKCPSNNCEMREANYSVIADFVPERLDVQHVAIKAGASTDAGITTKGGN